MTDEKIDKLRVRLNELRAERQQLEAKLTRLLAKLQDIKRDEDVIVSALQLIGEALPEMDAAAIAKAGARRRGGKLRALDVALQVIKPGETINKTDAARRAQESGIDFHSTNLANALGTAMSRSEQFEHVRRGVFRRVEQAPLRVIQPQESDETSEVDEDRGQASWS
jgi:phosphate uptake regulator